MVILIAIVISCSGCDAQQQEDATILIYTTIGLFSLLNSKVIVDKCRAGYLQWVRRFSTVFRADSFSTVVGSEEFLK